jgi:hypothetical protein
MSSETEQQDPNVPQNEDDGVDNKSQGTFKVPEQKVNDFFINVYWLSDVKQYFGYDIIYLLNLYFK